MLDVDTESFEKIGDEHKDQDHKGDGQDDTMSDQTNKDVDEVKDKTDDRSADECCKHAGT